mgnify:CR=1 FL=1
MADSGDIRARLQLRDGAGVGTPAALWAGELRTLLEKIEELGSLNGAAAHLEIEYRQAWRILSRAEALFGARLTAKRTGGRGGGGSTLTEAGRDLLVRVQEVLDDLGRNTARTFRAPLGVPGTEVAKAGPARGRGSTSAPARDVIVLASSTEPVDSGLLEALEGAFREDTGLTVRHIAAGSGQAHRLAESGRADAVLSHAPELEKQFMETGIGLRRTPIMKNRYLLLGPHSDPAGLKALGPEATLAEMLARIAERRARFVSRNDSSGTHLKELELWRALGGTPGAPDSWYLTPPDAGGSAAAVRCAVRLGAYTLTDSATASRHIELKPFVPAEAPDEENVYSVLVVDSQHVPGCNTEGALRLAEWCVGDRAKSLIASYGGPAALFQPIR